MSESNRGALHEAINRAAGELPVGYNIRIEVENGAAWVEWTAGDAEWHVIEGEGYLSDDVSEAIDRAAISAAEGEAKP